MLLNKELRGNEKKDMLLINKKVAPNNSVTFLLLKISIIEKG